MATRVKSGTNPSSGVQAQVLGGHSSLRIEVVSGYLVPLAGYLVSLALGIGIFVGGFVLGTWGADNSTAIGAGLGKRLFGGFVLFAGAGFGIVGAAIATSSAWLPGEPWWLLDILSKHLAT